MSKGFVCHVRENIEGAVYIGRGTATKTSGRFYNPYRIDDEHDSLPYGMTLTRQDTIRLYDEYLQARPFLIRKLPSLRGKPLECWCRRTHEPFDREKNWCHGDVILAWLDLFTDERLRGFR